MSYNSVRWPGKKSTPAVASPMIELPNNERLVVDMQHRRIRIKLRLLNGRPQLRCLLGTADEESRN